MNWLRHAFATGSEISSELSSEDLDWLERFCQTVVRRRLTPAVLVALEMFRPLSGVVAQGLYFFTPVLSLLVSAEQVGRLAAFLQRSDAVSILCQRLEALEAELSRPKNMGVSASKNRDGYVSPDPSEPTSFSEDGSPGTQESANRLSVE